MDEDGSDRGGHGARSLVVWHRGRSSITGVSMRPRDFKFAELAQDKIEVRSRIGISIDPSSTAGVLRSRIENDQSCAKFFLRIMLRVVQNDNLQTLTDD